MLNWEGRFWDLHFGRLPLNVVFLALFGLCGRIGESKKGAIPVHFLGSPFFGGGRFFASSRNHLRCSVKTNPRLSANPVSRIREALLERVRGPDSPSCRFSLCFPVFRGCLFWSATICKFTGFGCSWIGGLLFCLGALSF